MPRKGENIYKRKDGRWEGRYIRFYDEHGKAKYGYVYARTYYEAKRRLIYKKAYVAKQTVVRGTGVAYEEILDEWIQFLRSTVKESTYAHYLYLINTHIRPLLGKYPVTKISTQLIASFIEHQLKHGRLNGKGALSTKTVSDILAIVKSSMEYARYNNIDVACKLGKLSIKQQKRDIRVLTLAEQKALVDVLTDEMDPRKFGVLLALYTGIRIGELCALQWEDISLERSILSVRKTMQRIQETSGISQVKTKVIVTEPKSKCSIRMIPIPAFLVAIAKQFSTVPKAFILSGVADKYVEPRTMQNYFKRYAAASDIENINFHALRHTFATRCVEVGFDIKSLSEILGHANVNITLNRYVHSSLDLKSSNMNKLGLPE